MVTNFRRMKTSGLLNIVYDMQRTSSSSLRCATFLLVIGTPRLFKNIISIK